MTRAIKVLPSRDEFLRLPPLEMSALVRKNIFNELSFPQRLRIVLMLGRPRTGIHALICYMLGLNFAGVEYLRPWVIALGALLYFIWASILANLEKNYADLEEDCQNVPGRVYLVAQLGYRNLWWDILFLHMVLLLAAMLLGITFFLFMLCALVVPHQYSFKPLRAKARPFWCLFIMAQLVVIPFMAGLLIGFDSSPGFWPDNFPIARCLLMIVFLNLWFSAKAMFKNVPDFAGDKAAGLTTSATICESRRQAAIIATAAEIIANGSLAMLVLLEVEEPRLLWALVWTFPILFNCIRLIASEDPAQNNQCLKNNALFGAGFMASVLLLIFPTLANILAIAVVMLIVLSSEWWRLDARRIEHIRL